jgi:hypothetical protein
MSHYIPWRYLGGKEAQLLLILDLSIGWGESSASNLSHTLPPGKGPPVPTEEEAGWAQEPVWMQRLEEKYFAPARD